MFKLSFKIWDLANVTLATVFLVAAGPGVMLYAALFSASFSLPALGFVYLLLRGLQRLGAGIAANWILLLTGTGLIAVVPCILLNLWMGSADPGLGFVMPLAAVSAYAAVVFVSPSLHNLFLKIRYATEG